MAASPQTSSLYGFFGRGGRLQQIYPGFEYRAGQIEMARAVADAIEERRHLLIEAGTGTGKTLAYLVPALASGRRVIVSTGTKNLQEQLVRKDVPLLEQALGRTLRVVCFKGRNNYACRHKIAEGERQPGLLGGDWDLHARIRDWEKTSETGDRAELDFLPEDAPLWERINARRETCTGAQCPRFGDCFLTALHQRALEADLVVTNHHLFFADLTLKERDLPGVLPPYEAAILDEAHEVEEIAGQYFGTSLSNYQIHEWARDCEAVARRRTARGEAPEPWARRSLAVAESGLALLSLFEGREGRHPFDERGAFLEVNHTAYERFQHGLAGLESELEGLRPKDEEIDALIRRVGELRHKVAFLFEEERPEVVFWYERRGRGVFLQATPIEIAELLRESLFVSCESVVLTSATLAVRGAVDASEGTSEGGTEGMFAYMRQRLGVDHAREQIVASPFDYGRQAMLYIAEDLPDPRSEDFAAAAAEEVAALLECSQGRAFVLATSAEQMRELHRRLEPRLPFPTLLQGTAPRHLLLERFRATPQAVLFATSSFWYGVDVQGEQLSCVIIDKLPFASPGDPVVAARIRALRAAGRNPFLEYQVPRAVLALKQGFGRLIRSSRDRGALALLDGRILRQPYGRMFLASLPPYGRAGSLADVRRFFAAWPPVGAG